jgi:GrpB-like predicted nucleotidyltransferase (UPF0157 family)
VKANSEKKMGIAITRFRVRSDATEFHPYDADLPDVFDQIRRAISDKVSGLRIEHIGSSSIRGLGGRNVIDVAISVSGTQKVAVEGALMNLGFLHNPFSHYLEFFAATARLGDKEFSILVYPIESSSEIFKSWISFRDYMKTHPEDAQEYGRIKQMAAAAEKSNGDEYQQAKTPFLISMKEKIEKFEAKTRQA